MGTNATNPSVGDRTTSAINSGVKEAKSIANQLFDLKGVQNLQLLRIGKPCGFSKSVDKGSRIGYYMESKMNIIDLVPCKFAIPLKKALESTNKKGQSEIYDALLPAVGYKDAVDEYQNICGIYGLDNNYGGLRLYITDETTATDQFDTQYADNLISSKVNTLSDMGRQFREFMRSVSSNYGKVASQKMTDLGNEAGKWIGDVFGKSTGEDLGKIGGAMGNLIAQGSKLSLPKIWSDSNYTPNLNAVVKLVSPYGHPDAIKEFIIRPLMYLLILCSARTSDGLSYRSSPKLSIKAYGIAEYPLASIAGLTIRRGGADTSFNIYRQPLSVDVSITFQTLINGFAVYDSAISNSDNKAYKSSNQITSIQKTDAKAAKHALFPTLGTYLDSLRPVALSKIVTQNNITSLPITPGLGNLAEFDVPSSGSKTLVNTPIDRPKGTAETMQETARNNANSTASATVKNQVDSGILLENNAQHYAEVKAKLIGAKKTGVA